MLMQDAIELSLGTAQKAHAVVLQEMEKGKFTWNEPDLVEKCKNRHTQQMLQSRILLVILKSVSFTTKESARMIMIMLVRASCISDYQYYDGQNTNTNICCTQQSAHSCQVSNSLDIQQSVPSLSGNFLRSSANLGNSCSLCTEICMDYTNDNNLAVCYFHGSLCMHARQKQCLSYHKFSSSYIGNDIAPDNLVASLSHHSQSLYSRQEQSFSYSDGFNFYNCISELNSLVIKIM